MILFFLKNVERGGFVLFVAAILSNPITFISFGTRIFKLFRASKREIAIVSFAATKQSGKAGSFLISFANSLGTP